MTLDELTRLAHVQFAEKLLNDRNQSARDQERKLEEMMAKEAGRIQMPFETHSTISDIMRR